LTKLLLIHLLLEERSNGMLILDTHLEETPNGRTTLTELEPSYVHAGLLQLSEDDDDDLEMDPEEQGAIQTMESNKGIPLNFDFVHLSFEDGELVKMEES
jgi:hypothetical protein